MSWKLLLALPFAAALGGWATISVEDLPDYLVAGQPARLTFTVRQHGVEPMNRCRSRECGGEWTLKAPEGDFFEERARLAVEERRRPHRRDMSPHGRFQQRDLPSGRTVLVPRWLIGCRHTAPC